MKLRSGLALPVLAACLVVTIGAKAADFEVRSPIIEPGEVEFDSKVSRGFDRRRARSGDQGMVEEFEYGITEWWSPAIEGEWNRPAGPDEAASFEALTLENRFQLAEQGRFWLDPGLFLEYERGAKRGAADAIRLGPLLRKDIGPTINLLNVLAVKEFGPGARRNPTAAYAWQTRWLGPLSPLLEPGFELYGGPAEAGTGSPTQHRAGPVLFGLYRFAERQDVRFEIGYLFGLNRATPDGTFKLLIGYEYQF